MAATSAVRLDELDGARDLLDEVSGHADRVERSWVPIHVRLTRAQLIGGRRRRARRRRRRRLCGVAQVRGRHEDSAGLLAESVERCVAVANVWLLVHALPSVAGLAVRRGDPDTGVRLFGAAASLAVDSRVSASFSLSRRVTRDGLDEAAFMTAWEAGHRAVLDEVVALARAVVGSGPVGPEPRADRSRRQDRAPRPAKSPSGS